MLMIVLGGVFLSLLGIGIRYMEQANSMQITFYRAIFQGFFIVVILMLRSRLTGISVNSILHWSRQNIGKKESISALLFSGTSIFLVLSITHTTVANAMLIIAMAPFVSGFFAWLLLKEALSKATVIAIIIAITGVCIMVSDALGTSGIRGIVYACLMTLCYGLFTVSLRANTSGNSLVISFLGSLFVSIILAVAIFFHSSFVVTATDLIICMLLGIFQVGLGTLLIVTGSRHVPAAQVTLLAMPEVILSPIWVWVGVGEMPTTATLVGGVFIIGAVILQTIQPTKSKNR